MKIKHIICLIFVFFQFSIIAQDIDSIDSKKLVLITKNDGGEFIGEIISDDGREILLMTTTIGKIYINKSDISEITLVDEKSTNIIGGEFRAEGPFTTRYFFTNNSLPIKKKEHYAMIQLYGPEFHFSLSDKLSLGVMASWIASPIAIASKLCLYSKNNTHISIGNIVGNSGYLFQGKVFGGLHWLTITKGDRMKNFSFSAGYGYIVDNDYNIISRDFDSYLGPSSYFQHNSPNLKYYIPRKSGPANRSRENAINNKLISDGFNQFIYAGSGYYGYNRRNDLIYKKNQEAYILSLAGIVPIGKKVSFIFDSMLFFTQNYTIQYEDHEISVEWEYVEENVTIEESGTFSVGVNGKAKKIKNSFNTTLLLMPSLRINQSYEKAFQLSLAGVITQDLSFPVPTISWLRKF